MYCLNTNAKHLLLPSQILVAQPQMVLDMQQAGLPSAMDVEGAPGQVIWGFVSGLYTLRIRVWPIIMLAVSSLPAESFLVLSGLCTSEDLCPACVHLRICVWPVYIRPVRPVYILGYVSGLYVHCFCWLPLAWDPYLYFFSCLTRWNVVWLNLRQHFFPFSCQKC